MATLGTSRLNPFNQVAHLDTLRALRDRCMSNLTISIRSAGHQTQFPSALIEYVEQRMREVISKQDLTNRRKHLTFATGAQLAADLVGCLSAQFPTRRAMDEFPNEIWANILSWTLGSADSTWRKRRTKDTMRLVCKDFARVMDSVSETVPIAQIGDVVWMNSHGRTRSSALTAKLEKANVGLMCPVLIIDLSIYRDPSFITYRRAHCVLLEEGEGTTGDLTLKQPCVLTKRFCPLKFELVRAERVIGITRGQTMHLEKPATKLHVVNTIWDELKTLYAPRRRLKGYPIDHK